MKCSILVQCLKQDWLTVVKNVIYDTIGVGNLSNILDVSWLVPHVTYKMSIMAPSSINCHVNALSSHHETLFEFLFSLLMPLSEQTAHSPAHPENSSVYMRMFLSKDEGSDSYMETERKRRGPASWQVFRDGYWQFVHILCERWTELISLQMMKGERESGSLQRVWTAGACLWDERRVHMKQPVSDSLKNKGNKQWKHRVSSVTHSCSMIRRQAPTFIFHLKRGHLHRVLSLSVHWYLPTSCIH